MIVVILEGMASNDTYSLNYELSYARALALYRLWNAAGIKLDNEASELIIAGSGTGGKGRYPPTQEERNQRFVIQILPKVGASSLLAPRQ